jgi:hypothetical protein
MNAKQRILKLSEMEMKTRKRNRGQVGLVGITGEHRELIFSPSYKNRSKKRAADFTRERKMPFGHMICFMMNMLKQSTQTGLDRYFDLIGREDMHMSQQAFSEARQKLKWEACRELMDASATSVYRCDYNTWHGYRVWAIDGSKMQLPSDAELRTVFGKAGRADGGSGVTAQASCLYDVLNDIIGDAHLEPITTDERTLCLRHLKHLCGMESFKKELVIMDRGYASAELIKTFLDANVRFLMRVRKKFNLDIDALPIGDHRCTLEQIPLRVVKFVLPSGEIETLITDLFDKRLGERAFKALYFKRWPVETKYGELKHKLEIENFSGRTKEAVYQDFYITAYLSNIIAVAANEFQPVLDDIYENSENIYEYKVNRNHAVGDFQDRFISALVIENDRKRADAAYRILRLLPYHATPVRPGRDTPRNPSARNAHFHFNRKSNC